MLDWLAVIIAIAALVFSILQFFCERNRNRKEATIHAFDQLEGSPFILTLFSVSKSTIDNYVKDKEDNGYVSGIEWDEINRALPLLEHFAVGINNKIYDIAVLNAMAGNKLIAMYFSCETLISHKREGEGNEKNYCEFEKMTNKLIEYRKKKKQSMSYIFKI